MSSCFGTSLEMKKDCWDSWPHHSVPAPIYKQAEQTQTRKQSKLGQEKDRRGLSSPGRNSSQW